MGIEVFAAIAALSALVQASFAAFQLAQYLSPGDIDAILKKFRKHATEDKWPAEQIAKIIDDRLLSAMKQNIENATERLKESLLEAGTVDAAANQALAEARQNICSELTRIRDLNGGSLPGIELQMIWNSHRCDN